MNQKNVGASVRQRLLNLSRARNVRFQEVLEDYVRERFLYRLSCSQHRSRFVLKGAVLFRVWSDEPHRATRDLDLLAYGNAEAAELSLLLRDICSVQVEDDGVEFQADSVRVEDIRDDQEYGGSRIRLNALLAGARISLQIDVGFGDVVTPSAQELTYPTVLDSPAPVVRAYPRETVIAEKFQAMVALGIANSRMKDFYDLYSLATRYDFDGSLLSAAIRSTFERRETVIPSAVPMALSPEFSQDSLKLAQWRAFITGGTVRESSLALSEVIDMLRLFLLPVLAAASGEGQLDAKWIPPGPWA